MSAGNLLRVSVLGHCHMVEMKAQQLSSDSEEAS